MRRRLHRLVTALGLAVLTQWAGAATLQVSPVTVEITSPQNGAALRLTNPGTTTIYGQVRVYDWDQRDGEDVQTPTTAVVASPPMIQVGPGAEQLIRLVRTTAATGAAEQSYRIVIDEIPTEDAARATGVLIRMRYSVPLFVDSGIPARAAPVIAWTLVRGPRTWQLRADNSGPQRARINSVWIADAHGKRHDIEAGLLGYALARRYRVWDTKIPLGVDPGARPIIRAVINGQATETPATLSPAPPDSRSEGKS